MMIDLACHQGRLSGPGGDIKHFGSNRDLGGGQHCWHEQSRPAPNVAVVCQNIHRPSGSDVQARPNFGVIAFVREAAPPFA
jgi:hypothetical protein